jgi:HEAT repeat protein
MNTTNPTPQHVRMADALGATDASVRLRAALAAGSKPDPGLLETLVERCAVESDFFVRDMLSWALTRLPPEVAVPRLRQELDAERPQARSQALHTLSKIGDDSAWPWITRDVLRDADDEVARTAWRVAVVLVPEDVIEAALEEAAADPDPAVVAHARATELLLQDPEAGFDAAIDEARRVVTLGPERTAAAAAAASGVAETAETVGC